METTQESDEAENRAMVIFSAHGTSGGTVNNVNGNFTNIEHAVYNIYNIVPPDEVPERLRSTYPPGSPPNESTTTNTIPIVLPSQGVAQPHSPNASAPPINQIAINTCDSSASATVPLIEIGAIVGIMDALIEMPSVRHLVTLPETIASLQRILKLTELAVRVYEGTPLAMTLSLFINADTERCRQLLKELSKKSNCRHVLSAAMLYYIRQYIWSRTGECSVSSGLNSKLQACHSSFAACILALGSFASYELKLDTGTGDLTKLLKFSLLYKQESTSLQHIRIDTVILVDHLGRHLPVPTIFCDSRQDFHVVITGFCRDQAGGSLIQRGDYRILSLDDDQVINPAEFHTALQPGMTVGMTIVLREQSQDRNSNEEHRCPRCNHINSKVITVSGWVTCRRCNGQFQISLEDDIIISPDIQDEETSPLPDEISLFRRICILQDGIRDNEGIASEIFDNERLNETLARVHESHEFIADREEAGSRLSAMAEDGMAVEAPEQREAEVEAKIGNGTEQLKKLKVPWLRRIFIRSSLGNTERSTEGLQTEISKALSPEASERVDGPLPKSETAHAASNSGKSSVEITPPPSCTMDDAPGVQNMRSTERLQTERSNALSPETSERADGFLPKPETAPDIHAASKLGQSSVGVRLPSNSMDNAPEVQNSQLLPGKIDAQSVSKQDIIIAVMGPTGSGKTSFIDMAIGTEYVPVGHNLTSCSRTVQGVKCRHPTDPDRMIVFLDTPGFDDSRFSDTDILFAISDWLTSIYKRGIMLSGILFLHRISDNHVSSTSRRNFNMFQHLCGTIGLPNVILVTNMWAEVKYEDGVRREDELHDHFWESMISPGARMKRFDNTPASAWEILDRFTGIRLPVQLKIEMVVQGKPLDKTSAGLALSIWLDTTVQQPKKAVAVLQKQLHDLRIFRKDARKAQSEKAASEKKHALAMEQRRRLSSQDSTLRTSRLGGALPSSSRASTISTYATAVPSSPSGSPPTLADTISIYESGNITLINSSPSSPSSISLPEPRQVPRVNYTAPETDGRGMAAAATVLMFAEDIAAISLVPFLGGILALSVYVVATIERMKHSEAAAVILAHRARRLNEVIIDQARLGNVPDDISDALKALHRELINVKTVLEDIKTRDLVHHMFLLEADEAVFVGCSDMIQSTYDMVQTAITVSLRT